MVGVYIPDLPDILRNGTGYPVEEFPGCRTRANGHGGYVSPGPLGLVVHHTASPNTAGWSTDRNVEYATVEAGNVNKPEYAIVVGREGRIIVTACGGTNGEGKGGPWNMSRGGVPQDGANNRLISLAVCYDGVGEEMGPAQYKSFAAVCNAILRHYNFEITDMIAHKMWVDPTRPGRKIDPWGPVYDGGDWGQKRPGKPDIDKFRGAVWFGYDALGNSIFPKPPDPPLPPPAYLEDDVPAIYKIDVSPSTYFTLDPRSGTWCHVPSQYAIKTLQASGDLLPGNSVVLKASDVKADKTGIGAFVCVTPKGMVGEDKVGQSLAQAYNLT